MIVLQTPAVLFGTLSIQDARSNYKNTRGSREEYELLEDLFQPKQNCLTVILNMVLDVMFSQKLVSEAKTCKLSGISETSAGLVDTRAILFRPTG